MALLYIPARQTIPALNLIEIGSYTHKKHFLVYHFQLSLTKFAGVERNYAIEYCCSHYISHSHLFVYDPCLLVHEFSFSLTENAAFQKD